MSAATRGRFCDRCQHEVADLTQASDNELLRAFTGPNAPKCARFDARQLDRALLPMPRRSGILPIAAFTSLLAVLTGCETIVQGEPRSSLDRTDEVPEVHATTGIIIPIPDGADSVRSVPPRTDTIERPDEVFSVGEVNLKTDTAAHMPAVGPGAIDPSPTPQE